VNTQVGGGGDFLLWFKGGKMGVWGGVGFWGLGGNLAQSPSRGFWQKKTTNKQKITETFERGGGGLGREAEIRGNQFARGKVPPPHSPPERAIKGVTGRGGKVRR